MGGCISVRVAVLINNWINVNTVQLIPSQKHVT